MAGSWIPGSLRKIAATASRRSTIVPGGTVPKATNGSAELPVTVRPAIELEKALIEGLFQFYAYDWSEMEPSDSVEFEVDANGCFPPYLRLSDYWEIDEFWPLLIQIDGKTIGFALINTLSHRGGVIERNMAEFFIARKHRRRGAGAAALREILRLLPGQWEIAVAERNAVARAFWAKAIASAPNVSNPHFSNGDGKQWRGPIWCFCAEEVAGVTSLERSSGNPVQL